MFRMLLRFKPWFGSSLATAVAATAVLFSAAPVAAATTWYVAPAGNDAFSCTSPATPCMNIKAAINKASAGDTIVVAAGTYVEAPFGGILHINKTLTLLGAQHGVDARVARGSESIISVPSCTDITASGVIVDGFTVENCVNPNPIGFGLDLGAGTTGTQVVNDIVQDNIVGIGLANSGGSQVIIEHDQIKDNNFGFNTLPAAGDGIYTDQFVGGGSVSNVLITQNNFIGNLDAGIDVSDTDAAHPDSGLTISSNLFDQNGRAALFFYTDSSTIQDNTISNNTLAGSAGLRIFDGNNGLSIMHNNLVNGNGMYGIHFSTVLVPAAPSSNVVINFNNIGATSTSFTLGGLNVDPGAHVGTVNAICNWWGSSRGPTNAGNPGGNGEAVIGDANFKPWWTTPSQTSPCPAPPKCKEGEQDNGDGDVKDDSGKSRGHFHFDECDSNQEFSHNDSDNNVDFHSSASDHGSPQFDANLPIATTTGHGWNNGQPVTYVLVVTAGVAPVTGFYSLTLSDATGVIYTSFGTLAAGQINVVG